MPIVHVLQNIDKALKCAGFSFFLCLKLGAAALCVNHGAEEDRVLWARSLLLLLQ